MLDTIVATLDKNKKLFET